MKVYQPIGTVSFRKVVKRHFPALEEVLSGPNDRTSAVMVTLDISSY